MSPQAPGRAVVLVLDSLGIGALPDAANFGDAGANTLGHIAAACAAGAADAGTRAGAPHWLARRGPLRLPNLQALGLGEAARLACGSVPAGLEGGPPRAGAFAAARERSPGKDTVSGHWELMGLPVARDWGYFSAATDSMPTELLDALAAECGLPGWLGNCHASGTEILQRLGAEHIASGKPIVYTSADSVLQIAAHEHGFGLDRLYALCEAARRRVDALNIGRVIARPFVGEDPASFKRSEHRRDYALPPTALTLLDALLEHGLPSIGIGKIGDIFAHRGLSEEIHAHGLDGQFEATLQALARLDRPGLVFTNFVDFDSEFGHRRDIAGYAAALEQFDRRLPELQALLRAGDLLVLTADHGNDPSWPGSDHTREHVPILLQGAGIASGSCGLRDSFADLGQTLASHFRLPPLAHGRSLFETKPGPA
jgi:phosphopentomutase